MSELFFAVQYIFMVHIFMGRLALGTSIVQIFEHVTSQVRTEVSTSKDYATEKEFKVAYRLIIFPHVITHSKIGDALMFFYHFWIEGGLITGNLHV